MLHWGIDSGQPWLLGRFGDALYLGGAEFRDYAVAPRLPDSKTNQLSFSAWVLADRTTRWAQIACEDGPRPWRFGIGLYEYDGDLCAFVCQADGKTHSDVREGAAKPFPTRQWQHVALVADGSVLRLYRNGVEVASTPCKGVVAAPATKYLTIGCANKLGNQSDVAPISFWEGRLDEIAIFQRALTREEIASLFHGQTPRPNDHEKGGAAAQR